jgi:fumarate reductase (CoM/CoB) subunit A|tara:strand:+ start:558 stop:2285 length:1728 start_codon:yes stop_codon:yes gene_type:complete
MTTKTGTLETDVLIVGGGGAGCRAAIEAHDQGSKVMMIVKGRLGHSGCTLNVGTSAGVGPWAVKEDSFFSSMRDLLAHGGYLGNQEMIKILTEDTPERIAELETWGVDFERNEDGCIRVTHAAKHEYPRNVTFKPRSPGQHEYGYPPGIAMMDALINQIQKRDILVMDEVMLVDLLKNEGKVVGVTALDYQKPDLLVIKAKATILATGSFSQIFEASTVSLQETGDGQAAAFRAGADLIDMENTQFIATGTGSPPNSVLLNARGEQFLERYGITSLNGVDKEALCYAVAKEIKQGGGTAQGNILVDMTGAWKDSTLPPSILATFEENLQSRGTPYFSLDNTEGFDPKTKPVETGPIAHTTTGGVRTNTRCETSIPGLYAAGAVAGGLYGHARPEGYTSMITVVFGKRSGTFASEYARSANEPVLDDTAVQTSLDRALSLTVEAGGIKPKDTKDHIKATMQQYAWVVKDEALLNRGLQEIRDTKEIQRITSLNSTFRVEPQSGERWVTAIEVPNMLQCAELMLVGSLDRKESRGAFFRDDYPETDNDNWLKNIISRTLDGEIVIDHVPVNLTYCRP